jgi:putative oxidoreductase
MPHAVNLLGRLLLAYMFVSSGWGKLTAYAATAHYLQSLGIPGALLPLVILAELGGGIAVLLGFLTRIAALGLAVFCVLTAVMVHYPLAQAATEVQIQHLQMLNVMKNLAIAGGFLVLAAHGAGKLSLDRKLGLRWM